jgi:glycosyltransferase involved in cell wall biosynthesis
LSQSGPPLRVCRRTGGPEQCSVCLLTSAQPIDYSRYLDREALSLSRAGYRVTLVGLNRTATSELPSEVSYVQVRAGKGLRKPGTIRHIFRAARELRADLYHCFDPWALAVGLLVTRDRPDARVIYDATESYPRIQLERRDLSFPLRWVSYVLVRLIEHAAVSRADWFIDTTRTRARRFARRGRRVSIVANFPPTEILPEPEGERKPWLVCTGLICRHRGFDVLLKAFALVAARLPHVRLRVMGVFAPGEGLEEWSREFLRRAGLESRVDFLGWIPTYQGMFRELASCSLGVILFQRYWWNDYTNLPDKLFDFMATGLAVVASRFPEMEQVVQQARCGWLVDPGNPASVAEVIERAFANPDELRARGEAGRKAVLDRYNWGAAERVLLDVYARLGR